MPTSIILNDLEYTYISGRPTQPWLPPAHLLEHAGIYYVFHPIKGLRKITKQNELDKWAIEIQRNQNEN